jgi:hypothetical protein
MKGIPVHRHIVVAILTWLAVTPVSALEPIGKPGWSGYVSLGMGFGGVKTNLLDSVSGFDVALGKDRIKDLGSPSTENLVLPMFAAEVGYTFSNGKTRFFLGNDFRDYVQFDRSTVFALRHDFKGFGTMQLAYLSTPLANTEVYADPYQTNAKREGTDFNEDGLRLTWDRIFGTGFELKVSVTEADLDRERSGQALELSAEDQALLDRNGDILNAELGYLFNVGGRHFLRPSIVYIDRDLDGEAMATDGILFELSHVYSQPEGGLRVVSKASYGQQDSDTINPIFGRKLEGDRYSLASTVYFGGAFGWKNWVPNAGFFYAKADPEIEFYESELWGLSAGVFRRF